MVAAGLTVVLVTLAGVAWYFASEIERGALAVSHDEKVFDLVVASVDGGTITLEASPGADANGLWNRPGTWGLEWDGGYGQAGAILDRGDHRVVRTFTLIEGVPTVGSKARIDPFAVPGDPLRAFGLPFEDVTIAGELGPLPAWYVPATGTAWAILVHGQGADRQDMLRMLAPLHSAGLHVLVISYRNDEGTAGEPDGRYHLGLTEWRDLEAAAQYALEHRASGLVLGGNSMGGAVIMSFLRESPLAERVHGVVLEAPLLDFAATVRANAPGALPGPVVSLAKVLAAKRFGLEWSKLDYLAGAGELRAPILLFHGKEDGKIPIETSEQLHSLRPELVTFIAVPGARHVQAWNMDPAAFDRAMADFLAKTVPVAGQ